VAGGRQFPAARRVSVRPRNPSAKRIGEVAHSGDLALYGCGVPLVGGVVAPAVMVPSTYADIGQALPALPGCHEEGNAARRTVRLCWLSHRSSLRSWKRRGPPSPSTASQYFPGRTVVEWIGTEFQATGFGEVSDPDATRGPGLPFVSAYRPATDMGE